MTAITFNLKPAIKLQATQSGLAVGPAGADGDDGAEVELQKSATHIQWRHVGDVSWTNLVALADITGDSGVDGSDGAAGADGTEIELQKSATHIQWRYVGGSTWTDLVALADITGPAGTVTAENIATAAHGASADTLTDDSEISFLKEVTSVWTLLKITWANIVSAIRTAFFGSTSGILKANGSGIISAASAGSDYQSPLTFGIANTNAVQIDSADVADNEYARFTANGLEGRTVAELRGDVMSVGSDADGDMYYRASGILARLAKGAAYQKLRINSGATAPEWAMEAEIMGFALSDETSDLTAGEKLSVYVPYAFTVTSVYFCVNTAPTGSAIQLDIEVAGTSILNAVLEIAASGFYATTSTFADSASSYALAVNDLLTFDFDQIGSTIAGKGAKVFLIGYKTSN